MENLNILEKLENEIFNHRKTNRGKRPKEIQISSKGIYEMKKTDLFQKDGGYTFRSLNKTGEFQYYGVKFVFNKDLEEDYKVIPDEWNDNGINVQINRPS